MRIIRHGIVDSTSERAFAALADGSARHGDAHVARGQSAGRGRLGRRWESPEGEGLYVSSIVLSAAPVLPAALTMAAGLGVLAAVHALGARAARLKWPNDILIDGAKLAGVLVESRGLDRVRPHAVVGVGLNVLQRVFSGELEQERPVTSLALAGIETSPERALACLLEHLVPRLEQAAGAPQAIARDYARVSELLGRNVIVRHGRRESSGRLVALGLDGLELQGDEGRLRIPLEHAQALEIP
jgi:BirA family biotin operon repressor/biotin-[acetyl-CoA-carboxylase] ligase